MEINEQNASHNNNSKKDFLVPISILIAGALIGGALIYSNFNKGADTGNINESANVSDNILKNPLQLIENDVILGDIKAPITIVEYSDLSCPFCAAAVGQNQEVIDYLKKNVEGWDAPMPKVVETYVKTGKVKLVFRYFPGHGSGEDAMKVAFCANEQGKFWEVIDKIFANQKDVADLARVKILASSVGADVSKIDACLSSKKYDNKLINDTNTGKLAGVGGTPGFFINGTKVEGAQPFSAFKAVIDQILNVVSGNK